MSGNGFTGKFNPRNTPHLHHFLFQQINKPQNIWSLWFGTYNTDWSSRRVTQSIMTCLCVGWCVHNRILWKLAAWFGEMWVVWGKPHAHIWQERLRNFGGKQFASMASVGFQIVYFGQSVLTVIVSTAIKISKVILPKKMIAWNRWHICAHHENPHNIRAPPSCNRSQWLHWGPNASFAWQQVGSQAGADRWRQPWAREQCGDDSTMIYATLNCFLNL